MFKDFEDFWKNSGILETDSYRCISETYEFTKDNIPQAFKSFGRNCFVFGVLDSFEKGERCGRINMIETMLTFFNILKTSEDINDMRKMIEIISERYTTEIEENNKFNINGF